MIDIHPAHHAATSRREFFIHIATIVLGILIALGLEQTIEVIHHYHQRRQLEEDLREEAQHNVGTIQADEKSFAVYVNWYRDILTAGREAKPAAGFVTLAIPSRVDPEPAQRPMDNVWPAAKASGAVAALPRDEIEVFGRVSTYAEYADQISLVRQAGLLSQNAVLSRLGLTLDPGTTVRMAPQDRDELMRAVANHLEGYRQLSSADATWQGVSEAVLHGVRSIDEFSPYIRQAQIATQAQITQPK